MPHKFEHHLRRRRLATIAPVYFLFLFYLLIFFIFFLLSRIRDFALINHVKLVLAF